MIVIRCFVLLLCIFYGTVAHGYSFIRDSELESVISNLVRPIFEAAKIDQKEVKVIIVNSKELNAFVIDNNNIFINSGLLTLSHDPHIMLGVLAHEIGHIAAGHTLGRADELRTTMLGVGISYILGIISAITVGPEVGPAVFLGGLHVNERLLLRYSRVHEDIADQYALRYLEQAKYSNRGMKEFFEILAKKYEIDVNVSRYVLTHPLSKERMLNVQDYKFIKQTDVISPENLAAFARSVTKLDAFLSNLDLVMLRYSDDSVLSQYAQSIYYYRKSNFDMAISKLDNLINNSPKDPYLYELKAQMLYKMGEIQESILNYEKSLRLSNDDFLIKFELTQMLLMHDTKRAGKYLEQLIAVDPYNSLLWLQMSIVYRSAGQLGLHYFALTKKAWLEHNTSSFYQYADLALQNLPAQSSYTVIISDMRNQLQTQR